MPAFHSRCHCGNLQAEFETRLHAQELTVRSCQCSFCTRHRTRTVADKDGRARIHVRDPELLSRYQWNTRTAEFLVCGRCGNYLGAAMPTSNGSWVMALNVNLFHESPQFTQEPLKVSYDNEPVEARRLRRESTWTPTVWEHHSEFATREVPSNNSGT
jgi:hypothetical protein